MIPKITVLLPVYQVATLLDETFAGLAAQTEPDFEVLAFYDPSTDGTLDKLLEIKQREPRLKIFAKVSEIEESAEVYPQGLVERVVLSRGEFSGINYGIRLSRSPYLAIHHHDDISLPERFAEQIAFLDAHPEIGLLGTWVDEFSEKGIFPQYPTCDEAEIKAEFLIHGPIIHATSMFRRSVVLNPWLPFPEERFPRCADKPWQIMMLERTRVTNLPKVLYRKRSHSGQVSVVSRRQVDASKLTWAREALAKLDIQPTEEQVIFHRDWPTVERPLRSYLWARRLICGNRRTRWLDEAALKKVLGTLWLSSLRYHMPNHWLRALYFLISPVSGWVKPHFFQRIKWAWRLWKKDYTLSIWFQK